MKPHSFEIKAADALLDAGISLPFSKSLAVKCG